VLEKWPVLPAINHIDGEPLAGEEGGDVSGGAVGWQRGMWRIDERPIAGGCFEDARLSCIT
jgi:hypothetical protein